MRIKPHTALLLLLWPVALFAKQPNILFILADDLGWKDTAVSGSTFYQTPHIDALAAEGVRFTDAYAAPLCSPSRAAALTGRQPERFQMFAAITRASEENPGMPEEDDAFRKVTRPDSRNHLPTDETTIAELLRDAGYKTSFIGKWHLGTGREYNPINHGFEKVVVAGGAAAGYFAPYRRLPAAFSKNSPKGEYLPERFSQETIKILRQHQKKTPDQPFFIALWHFNVHSGYEAKPEVVAKYKPLVDPENPQQNPIMAGMIEGLDDSVGAVLAELETLGLAEDTIVVFASDNGGVALTSHKNDKETPPTSNLPYRGWKGCLMEGGIRVPMIVRWPGVTQSGVTENTPVHLVDLLPTLANAAGAELPRNEIDGIDLRPALEGKALQRERPLLWYFPNSFIPNGKRPAAAIRSADYKLIRFFCDNEDGSDAHELYNIANDPEESNDLATSNPEQLAVMLKLLDEELAHVGARIPFPNPAYDPNEPEPKPWQTHMAYP